MDICCELQKLPNLVKHYEEHKKCNDDSILEFFVNDYINFDGLADNHKDDSNHQELPFHGNHQCNHGSVYYSVIQSIEVSSIGFQAEDQFSHYTIHFSSKYPDSPFQPPKV